jgi:hypothetical protein
MATWILILAWMSRHAYPYGGFPGSGGLLPGGGGLHKPFP